jgi:alanine racemase
MIDAGIDIFGVATVNEAQDLRDFGFNGRILLLTTPFELERLEIARLDLETLVSDAATGSWLSATAGATGRILRTHLYADTGMTRNGVTPEEAPDLARHIGGLDGLQMQGVASHLATSDEPDPTFARLQLDRFDGMVQRLEESGFTFEDVHIANSGGILSFPESHYTMVRPGISLYGYHPNAESQNGSGLEPVMSIRTVLSSIRSVPADTPVSYGCRYRTSEPTLIATLPIGYGDGLLRGLGGKMEVLIGGERYPVAGTICMDEIMVDLGPSAGVSVGEEAIVIGRSKEEEISAWDLAVSIGSIPYEVTTSLAPRVPRIAVQEETNGPPLRLISPFDSREQVRDERPTTRRL